MGDMDDGFNDTEVEFITMYQYGHTDGYTRSYSGPLYESADAADFASEKENGGHAVESKQVACIRLLNSKRVYIVDGPYKTIKDVEMESKIKAAALAKLTDAEKKVLGLK